MCGGQVLVS